MASPVKNENAIRAMETFLHAQIPITREMGVRVASYDGQHLVIRAPLASNHNHLGTAFGGSLGAVAMLSGYGLLWLALDDPSAHVVVRECTMAFRRPVHREICSICRHPGEAAMGAFKEELGRKGTARIRLEVTIEENGLTAVEFSGTFVAQRSGN